MARYEPTAIAVPPTTARPLTAPPRRLAGGKAKLTVWEAQYAEAHQRRSERYMLQQMASSNEVEHPYAPTLSSVSASIARSGRSKSAINQWMSHHEWQR